MEYIASNTANQDLYLTLNEARTFLSTYTHYLIVLISQQTNGDYAFVANVIEETDRYTKVRVSTNANNPTASSVLITTADTLYYTVYGQNSSTNLDPTDSDVVGIVQRGWLSVDAGNTFVTETTTTIPDDITA